MKKTALMLALMTLAGAAMAEGGCRADYDRCQPESTLMQTAQNDTQASAPAQDASAPAAAQTSDGDAWVRYNQQSIPTHSSR